MNTKTRTEKLAEVVTEVKVWTIRILLITWAMVTFSLGICYGMEKRRNDKLEERLNQIESTYTEFKDSVDAIYVYHR